MTTEHSSPRQRPKWACRIHDLGDDLHWAVSSWCDFPRPARRFVAGVIAAVGAHGLGASEAASSVVSALLG